MAININTVVKDGGGKKTTNKKTNTNYENKKNTNPVANNANDGMNLSGVDNIASARGTSGTKKASTNNVVVNKDESNLAGTNNIKNAYGTSKKASSSKADVYVPDASGKNTNSYVTKQILQRNDIKNALSNTADESNKKAQATLNKIGEFFQPVVNLANNVYQANQAYQDDYNQQRQARFEKSRQKDYAEYDAKSAQLMADTTEDDIRRFQNPDGSVVDFDSQIRELESQQASLYNIIDNADNEYDVNSISAQKELDRVQTELDDIKLLRDKFEAFEENYILNDLKASGDEEKYKQYREQFSHKFDTFGERTESAVSHLLTQTVNEIPTYIDQTLYATKADYAKQGIDGIKGAYENGDITTDEYVKALAEVDDKIKQAQREFNDSTSQEIRRVVDQYGANTYYGADDIEKFILQSGESTAQFLLHYAISTGVASVVFKENTILNAGKRFVVKEFGEQALADIATDQLMQYGINALGGDLATISMSVLAGTEKTNQLLDEGVDINIAQKCGFYTGLVEGLIEKTGSVDRFVSMLGTPISSQIFGELILSGVSEGGEEVVGNIIDPLIEHALLGRPYEVDGNELKMAFLLGGVSGLAMAGGAMVGNVLQNSTGANALRLVVNNRQQRQMLLNEINMFVENRPTMTPEQQTVADELIEIGSQAVNEYDAKSTTLGVSFSSDMVEPIPVQESNRNVVEALEPYFNQEVQTINALDNLQSEVDNNIDQVIYTENNVLNRTQELLAEKGYNIEAELFTNLDDIRKNDALVALDFGKAMGIDVVMVDNLAPGVNGFVDSNGTIVIDVNKKPILSTLSHELTHGTESSQFYSNLKNMVQNVFGDNWNQAVQNKINEYAQGNIELDADGAERELVARFFEENLNDEQFLDDLIKYNYSLASRIYQNLLAFGDNSETAQIKNAFERAFRDNYSNNGVVLYSIDRKNLKKNSETLDTNYSQKEIDITHKNGDFIEGVDYSIKDFLDEHGNDSTRSELWLGKIKNELADRVFNDTGFDIHGKSLTIPSDNDVHLQKHFSGEDLKYGSPEPITLNDLESLGDIINNYDRVEYYKDGNQDRLKFETDVDNNDHFYRVIEMVPTRNKNSLLVTIYTVKKGNSQAPNATSVAPGTSTSAEIGNDLSYVPSNNTLSYSEPNVNNDTYIGVAPFFKTEGLTEENFEEKIAPSRERTYNAINDLAKAFGADVINVQENVGGYTFNNGKNSTEEPSYTIQLGNVSQEDATLMGCLLADYVNENQESVAVNRYINDIDDAVMMEYTIKYHGDHGAVRKIFTDAGFRDFTQHRDTNTFVLFDFDKMPVADFKETLDNVITALEQGGYYEGTEHQPMVGSLINRNGRRDTYEAWLAENEASKQNGVLDNSISESEQEGNRDLKEQIIRRALENVKGAIAEGGESAFLNQELSNDYTFNGKTVAWKDDRIRDIIDENEKGNFAFSGHDPYQYFYAINLSPEEYMNLTQLFDERHNRVWHEDIEDRNKDFYNNGDVDFDRLVRGNKRLADYMYLLATDSKDGFKVRGQEGNHRAIILSNNGFTKMPVILGTNRPLPYSLALSNKGIKLRGKDLEITGVENPNEVILKDGDFVEFKTENYDELVSKFGSGSKPTVQYSFDTDISDKQVTNADATKNIENVMSSKGDNDGGEKKVAKILEDVPEPRTAKEKLQRALRVAKHEFIDHLDAVEELSRASKNPEIIAKADYAMLAPNIAGEVLLNERTDLKTGKVIGKAITKIIEQIPKEQRADFYDYLYNYRNLDSTSLRERLGEDYKNKYVFGEEVTHQKSLEAIQNYEAQHPEFKKVAEEVWKYFNQDLDVLLEYGVISQEQYDEYKRESPHYVPILRNVDKGGKGRSSLDPNKAIKEFKGSNIDLLPFDEAVIRHTNNVYKSALSNELNNEIMNTLGNSTVVGTDDVDSILDNDYNPLSADQGAFNLYAYKNGQKFSMPINEDLYNSLRPSQNPYGLPNIGPVQTFAEIRRNIITGWNPIFWITNGIKDIQDAVFNTKYPKQYLLRYAEAWAQILSDGDLKKLYIANGGDSNSYIKELGNPKLKSKNPFSKALNVVVDINEAVEMAPRLAEFIATLKDGKSISQAMLNSAEVTTNFKRGGDTAKFINRNGFAFLNASIQGFNKQIKNIQDAKDGGLAGMLTYMAKASIVGGMPLLLLNGLMWKDDDDYDELSDYVKQNYYVLKKYGDGKFIKIPKGRIASFFQTVIQSGIDTAKGQSTLWDALLKDIDSFADNIAPNNLSDTNPLAPILQAKDNKTWYGSQLVPQRLQSLPESEQYDETTDDLSIWIGQQLGISPYKVNYVIDQYSGGLGDIVLPMLTLQAENPIDNPIGQGLASPFIDRFTTDSVLKNQNVTSFFDLKDELQKKANSINATDEEMLAYKYLNTVNTAMSDLYKEKRQIQADKELSSKEKYNQTRELQKQIDELAKDALANYDQIDIEGDRASVGGVQYYRGEDGWKKMKSSVLNNLNSSNVPEKDKTIFYNTYTEIESARAKLKAQTDGKADYRQVTIDAIRNADMSDEAKNQLYNSYYSNNFTRTVDDMDLSDKDKLEIKIAGATAEGVKNSEGKTVTNSKALEVADRYADLGLLDDVFDYIAKKGISPSDLGLTKKVYSYSYDEIAQKYQETFNQPFGKDNTFTEAYSKVYNNSSSSTKKSSKGSEKSSKSNSKKSSGHGHGHKKTSTRYSGRVSGGGGYVRTGRVTTSAPRRTISSNSDVMLNNYLRAYSNGMSNRKPSSGGSLVVCPKCGNRVTPVNGRCPICGTSL